MATVLVDPGICGLETEITAVSDDMQNAVVNIQSDCPHILAMAAEMDTVDSFTECFKNPCEGRVYKLARKHCKHASCPIPCAILKAVEVACGLSLPKHVEFKITK